MAILLVNPSFEGLVSKKGRLYNWHFPPLDLLNISAILKGLGKRTKVLDLRVRPLADDELTKEFDAAEKVILTSSPLDRWQCPNLDLEPVFRLASLVRDKSKLILIGAHGTKRTGAATVIEGEPEGKISALFGGKELRFEEFPVPDYGAVSIKDYRYELLGGDFALLQFSRGCPFDCIFCLKKMYGDGYRMKSPDKFINEIEYVVRDIRARSVYFYDLTFTAHRPSVLEICWLIKERGLKFDWCCQTRAEMVDEELLREMRAAGCKLIHFGVESGSEKVSKSLDKRIDIQQIKKGVALAKRAGIPVACFFMFGFPGEKLSDMEKTIDLAVALDPDYASFHIAIPYPGTKFHQLASMAEECPEMYNKEVPSDELRAISRKAFMKFYLRPRYILKKMFTRPAELASKVRLFLDFIK
ncbi:MAG TPA: radical SAM protein [Candidatus Omnitrophota bacterium]|nr:radical SAM protein [Candidatus Omnitrophota bacterium]